MDDSNDPHPPQDDLSSGELPTGSPVGTTTEIFDEIDDTLTDDDFDVFGADFHDGAFRTPPPPRPGSVPGPDPRGGARASAAHPAGPAQGPRRRLVRDPNSRLGGVASGLAHYLGFEVAPVRILFVVVTILTGAGFFLYPLAWLFIPRAAVWPPVGHHPLRKASRSIGLSTREMALGLAVLAVLLLMSFGDGPGRVLVPLILIGAGVWLLRQSPGSDAAPDGAIAPMHGVGTPVSVDDEGYEPWHGEVIEPPLRGGASQHSSHAAWAAAATTPQLAPQRSLPRRMARGALVLVALAIPLVALAGVGIFVAGADEEIGGETIVRPATLAEMPRDLNADIGTIVLDLSRLTPDMFESTEFVSIDLGAGEMIVTVPNDLTVAVDASVNVGEIEVFGSERSGIGPDLTLGPDNPDLSLSLSGDAGRIEVRRAAPALVVDGDGGEQPALSGG